MKDKKKSQKSRRFKLFSKEERGTRGAAVANGHNEVHREIYEESFQRNFKLLIHHYKNENLSQAG